MEKDYRERLHPHLLRQKFFDLDHLAIAAAASPALSLAVVALAAAAL